jgi:hypothetical protein
MNFMKGSFPKPLYKNAAPSGRFGKNVLSFIYRGCSKTMRILEEALLHAAFY